MANNQHRKYLKQGASAWNKWRKDNPQLLPDLSGADLKKRSLRNYDLNGANLAGADLRNISFRRADLRDANLTGAKLSRAFFSRCRLRGADFRLSLLYETVFANVNLGKAKNVDKIVHRGPSVVDHRTLARSGDLPLAFLRGCGLPDSLISQVREDRDNTKGYSSCFISHSSEDQGFVDKLYADLQEIGVRCWLATKDSLMGADIREEIDDSIRGMEKLLIVLSKSAAGSGWVKKEYETAFEEEQRRGKNVVLPIRIDGSPLDIEKGWIPEIRRSRIIGDFSNWRNEGDYQNALKELLRGLEKTNK